MSGDLLTTLTEQEEAGDPNLITTFTVNVGTWDADKVTFYGYGTNGSVSPSSATLADDSSYTIEKASWGNNQPQLELTDTGITNSDVAAFTTLKIGSETYDRDNASYSGGLWTWSSETTNPFGTTTGVDVVCELRSD